MTVATARMASAAYIGTGYSVGTRSSDSKKPSSTDNPASAPAKTGNPSDVVSLSALAQATLSAGIDYYAQFFPTRDGTAATALAAAVVDPASVSSSAGKSFDQVAADARKSIDDKYAAMAASGQPFDYNSWEGKDWYAAMGDLDRRSLYAVSSNAGGKFTQQEQDMAQSIMGQQQGLAMGLYSGPISQEGKFVNPYGGDHAAPMPDVAAWLDSVSDEEKSSIPWAVQRASVEFIYHMETGNSDIDSTNPLVKLIRSAMETMKINGRGTTTGIIKTAEDLKSQSWFKGFESQLDSVLAEANNRAKPKVTDTAA